MIRCNLDQLLAALPAEAQRSMQGHSRAAGVEWAVFRRMLHNHNRAATLESLAKLRAYLDLPAGETRFHLAELMKEKKYTRDMLLEGIQKKNTYTISHMTNNTLQRADFGVMEALCEFMHLDSLDQLLDTGGLLVWEKDGETR